MRKIKRKDHLYLFLPPSHPPVQKVAEMGEEAPVMQIPESWMRILWWNLVMIPGTW
ncbi:hypothetical protein GDO86_020491 [Hymenochirus boettgeri]|uniref:Uncharacterized protein n=1 Tax=Hymenochirus boettgeri TaxID=247094 RepID=A0A8T2IFN3_9PIPI|nr:hypothetical protein GDO86_020491 [Hymenochirus boettgeri]